VIELAGEANEHMPHSVVAKIAEVLNAAHPWH
jgi:hypothetical protein